METFYNFNSSPYLFIQRYVRTLRDDLIKGKGTFTPEASFKDLIRIRRIVGILLETNFFGSTFKDFSFRIRMLRSWRWSCWSTRVSLVINYANLRLRKTRESDINERPQWTYVGHWGPFTMTGPPCGHHICYCRCVMARLYR